MQFMHATWDRPSLLVLAALAAVAPWLLGRLRERRARVTAGSLLLYERALEILAARSEAAAPRRERRRILDARVLAETAALVLLALAAAGPRLEGARPLLRRGVVLDDSPSMRAAGRGDLEALATRLGPRDGVLSLRASAAPPGAPDAIGWSVAALRAQGAHAVLAVTDHAVATEAHGPAEEGRAAEEGGAAEVAPGSPPLERGARPDAVLVVTGAGLVNRGIVAAGVTGRDLLARSNAPDALLRVRDDGGQVLLEGTGRELRGVLPAGATATALRVEVVGPLEEGAESYEDALAEDDRARLEPPGAPVRVRIRGPRDPRLLRALEAAGADPEGDDDAEATISLAAEADRDAPAPASLRVVPAPWLRHADLASIQVRAAPLPHRSPGRPLLVDEAGRAVISVEGGARPTTLRIHVPLEETDWPTRRSFPVLLAEWLDAVAGDARLDWRALGLLSSRETVEAGPPADLAAATARTFEARIDAALAEMDAAALRSPRVREAALASSTPLERPLALAGALSALLAWTLARDRRAAGHAPDPRAAGAPQTTTSRRESPCVVS